jgi:tRNA threonylcarbamoyladenosine biosynthesis protein TsaB
MKLLAIDTTLETCSVAVLLDDALAAHRAEQIGRGHAEALMPMIDTVLAEAGAGYADLDAVAVTTGPGSFTGQRVGLSAARGIGLARSIPVKGVTTLGAMAYGLIADGLVQDDEDILVALDARRNEVYLQHFQTPLSWPCTQSQPAAIPVADLKSLQYGNPCVVAGTGSDFVREALGEATTAEQSSGLRFIVAPTEADARHVGALALQEIAGAGMPTTPPAPLYLRAPDAKLPGGKTP